MAENIERIQLPDEEGEFVSGGQLKYVSLGDKKYCYSKLAPDTRYGFSNYQNVKRWVAQNCLMEDDNIQIQKLLAAGLIWPLQ